MNDARPESSAQIRAKTFERLLLDKTIRPGAFRLMHYLVNHSNKGDSCCWPGRRRMQRDLGGQMDSFKTWIAQLEKSCWLRAEDYSPEKHPFVRKRDKAKRDGKIYWLLNGDRQKPQPFWKAETPVVVESGNTSGEKPETPAVSESGNETYRKGTSTQNLQPLNLKAVQIAPLPAIENSNTINPETTKPGKLSARQRQLADRFETALSVEWTNDAGKWINRIKSASGKCERVIAEVENAAKEGRIKTTPARYAEQMWKEFR